MSAAQNQCEGKAVVKKRFASVGGVEAAGPDSERRSPAQMEILNAAERHLESVHVMHNQVLVAVYLGANASKGGVLYSDIRKHENEHQGKVGLVLKVGPLAFVDDERNKFHGERVEVGDWIALRPGDGWPCRLGGIDGIACRVLEDVHVKMRVSAPDIIY